MSVGDVARITSSAADGLVYPSSRVGVPNALSLVVLEELKSFLKDERNRFAGSTRAESFKRLDDWIERKVAQVLFDPEAPAHSNLRPTGSESDRSSSGDFRRKTSARGYAQGHEIKSNRGKRKDGSQSDEERERIEVMIASLEARPTQQREIEEMNDRLHRMEAALMSVESRIIPSAANGTDDRNGSKGRALHTNKTRTRGWGVAPYAVDDAAAPVRESVCAVKRVGEKEVPLCNVFTK